MYINPQISPVITSDQECRVYKVELLILVNSAYVNKEEMSDWRLRKLKMEWEVKQGVSINIREYIFRNQLEKSIQGRGRSVISKHIHILLMNNSCGRKKGFCLPVSKPICNIEWNKLNLYWFFSGIVSFKMLPLPTKKGTIKVNYMMPI